MGRPALVVGPIVRYCDQTSFSVWLELDRPATVVGQAVPAGGGRHARVDSRIAQTAGIHGRHYVLVYFEKLKPGTTYKYAITAAPWSAGHRTPRAVRRARGAIELALSNVTYGEPPSVRTLPRWRNERLRAAFGSCRCFEGGYHENKGPDVLELFGAALESHAIEGRRPGEWPHLLFLMGDQIYADDVGPTARKRMLARDRSPRRLPTRYTADRELLERAIGAGDTSRFAGAGDFHCVDFADYADLYATAWSTPDVRALFARLPVFMLPDDHDITDDFMITGGWLEEVLNDVAWRKTVTEALTAFWVYQGWGNFTRDAAAQHPIAGLLAAAGGRDVTSTVSAAVLRALRREIHAPVYFSVPTEPPIIAIDARTDRTFAAPKPDPRITGSTEVNVMAHRDDRMLGPEQSAWLEQQVKRHQRPVIVSSVPIFTTPYGDYALGTYTRPEEPIMPPGTWRWSEGHSNAIEVNRRSADTDTWFAFPRSVNWLFRLLATRRETVVVAGDVHFSFALQSDEIWSVPGDSLDHAAVGRITSKASRIVHIVSSALQNEWSDETARVLEGMNRSPDTYPLRRKYDDRTVGRLWKHDRIDRTEKRYGTRNNICVIRFVDGIDAIWHGAGTGDLMTDPLTQLAHLVPAP